MKFFDINWIEGSLSNTECELRKQKYYEHIKVILESSNLILSMLIKNVNLHDAVMINYIEKEKEIIITFCGGDNQKGYFLLDLSYYIHSSYNKSFFNKLPTIILYDEYEYLNDKKMYLHSFINSHKKEMQIMFSHIDFSIKNTDWNMYKRYSLDINKTYTK